MLSFLVSYYICWAVGLVFPIYASYKAIESSDFEDDKQWLSYWVVYATLNAFEVLGSFILDWIPLYYEVKLLCLIWLIAPNTQGARVMYDEYLRPYLVKNMQSLDRLFSKANQVLGSDTVSAIANVVEKEVREVEGAILAKQGVSFVHTHPSGDFVNPVPSGSRPSSQPGTPPPEPHNHPSADTKSLGQQSYPPPSFTSAFQAASQSKLSHRSSTYSSHAHPPGWPPAAPTR